MLRLAIWALFLRKLKLNLYAEGSGREMEGWRRRQRWWGNCQKATILLISFSLCAFSKKRGEKKKGALIIRGVESSNR